MTYYYIVYKHEKDCHHPENIYTNNNEYSVVPVSEAVALLYSIKGLCIYTCESHYNGWRIFPLTKLREHHNKDLYGDIPHTDFNSL